MAWSGGKDSAMALREIQRTNELEICALLTTVTEGYDRISMHGVRNKLLVEQANSAGYPLEIVTISKKATNEEYDGKMRAVHKRYLKKGVSSVVFGDIFLEDVRRYRKTNLSKIGMEAVFPLWGEKTAPLARNFIRLGFEAIITCVDTRKLDKSFSGREFDLKFLSDLPAGVDPCGENGEFHSFVYDGPIFTKRIDFRKGKKVLRDNRYCFCDLQNGR